MTDFLFMAHLLIGYKIIIPYILTFATHRDLLTCYPIKERTANPNGHAADAALHFLDFVDKLSQIIVQILHNSVDLFVERYHPTIYFI
jgi:hypothetical protein